MQESSNLELNYPVMVWTFYRYGALLVAMETTVCIRRCLNFKKNILLVSYFHISHKNFGTEYVYSKDKFWPKSPVVKYSPRNESMLPDRVSNPGPLTYESGALPSSENLKRVAKKVIPRFSLVGVSRAKLLHELEKYLINLNRE